MGKGGGGSSSGKTDYPEYMKTFHGYVLNGGGVDMPSMSLIDAFNVAVAGNSPYYNYKTQMVDISAVFGNAASLEFDQVFKLTKDFSDINFKTELAYFNDGLDVAALVNAVSTTLDDEILVKVMPKFKANLRGIGAVQSSAYVVGEALIWDSKVKALAKERLAIEEMANRHRDTSLRILMGYLEFTKLKPLLTIDAGKSYFSLMGDLADHYSGMAEKDLKWDLEMFQYLNHGLGAISGSAISIPGKGPSKIGSAVGGALSGAAMGALAGAQVGAVGGPLGAAVGGALGLAGALLS